MIAVTIVGIFMAILFILSYMFRLFITKFFWFCKCPSPWMFPPLDIPFEYWIERVTCKPLYVMFRIFTRIFYRGVSGVETDCPWGVWCRGLTLYAGPLFGSLDWNDNGFVSLTNWRTICHCFRLCFTYISMPHNMIISVYLIFMSKIMPYFLYSTLIVSF